MPIPTLRELWTDIRLRFAGQRRVAPYGSRGRTHSPIRPEEVPSDGAHRAKGEPLGTVSARVYRQATGEWEDLGVIAEADMDIINQIRATKE